MLMRCATAYGSSSSQIITLLQPKIAEKSLKINIFRAQSFKLIDVDISKKLIASACYDKQHVCAYLQPFSH